MFPSSSNSKPAPTAATLSEYLEHESNHEFVDVVLV
jgi:hypothetical protein